MSFEKIENGIISPKEAVDSILNIGDALSLVELTEKAIEIILEHQLSSQDSVNPNAMLIYLLLREIRNLFLCLHHYKGEEANYE